MAKGINPWLSTCDGWRHRAVGEDQEDIDGSQVLKP